MAQSKMPTLDGQITDTDSHEMKNLTTGDFGPPQLEQLTPYEQLNKSSEEIKRTSQQTRKNKNMLANPDAFGEDRTPKIGIEANNASFKSKKLST